MPCNEPAYADVGVATPRYSGGSPDEPLYEAILGGGGCTVWDGSGTTWDAYEVAGVEYFTRWDCGPPDRPLYARNPVPLPSYRSVLEGGVCTIWDAGGTTWDEYEEAGVSYFTRWDCGGNPPSDDLEDLCQP